MVVLYDWFLFLAIKVTSLWYTLYRSANAPTPPDVENTSGAIIPQAFNLSDSLIIRALFLMFLSSVARL